MLKTLKWVYELGVKHERQRIARYLEGQGTNLNNEFDVGRNMLSDIPDSAKQRKQRLELKQAVTMRVSEIVNGVLNPQYEDRATFSVMFPDEDKK